MTSPTFSVIIPAFNSSTTLARALDSVLNQEYAALEVIVVDDASTDDTAAVISRYGSKVESIRQPVNQGVAAARNRGAAAATGEWLAFLDADDYYFPCRLARHAEWIVSDSELDLLTGDYEYRSPEGNLLGTSMAAHPAGRELLAQRDGVSRVTLDIRLLEEFVAEHFGDTHTLSIPRKRFLASGGYPTGFKVCEDVHLLTRLVATSRRIGVCCVPLGVYVVHANSATRRNPVQAQRENVRTLEHLSSIAPSFPAPVRRGVARRLRSGRLNLAFALLRQRQRLAAIQAVLPLLREPSGQALRDVASVVRG